MSPFVLRGGLSKSLLIYMYHQLFYSTASAPYHVYQIWRWRATHSEPLYDARFLYWSGIWGMNYMWITPLAVLLLTVDRCLMLSLPLRYSRRVQSRVIWMGLGLVLLGTAANTWLLMLELPLDLEKTRNCETISCVLVNHALIMPQLRSRPVFATLNVTGSILFIYLLKRTIIIKLNDRVVRVTVIMELLFDAIPGIIFDIFNEIIGIVIANYAGGIGGTLVTVDGAICSALYSSILLTRKHKIEEQQRLKLSDEGLRSDQNVAEFAGVRIGSTPVLMIRRGA
ncbi:hypothetical protein DdX_09417 [Ditylenchus destructor]|uniref:G protein-coupled receptor n=1 Tax=Ditylenchus destructor TaxID=166010 RepID=A0AAD4MZS4_9BILA|nr:hypothetical protein DdX_09417 [Ditylenchus destructor]